MDFAYFDKVKYQINLLVRKVGELKTQNRDLKLLVEKLENGNGSTSSSGAGGSGNTNNSQLIEERDRLVMERDYIRQVIEKIIDKVDMAIKEKSAK